MKQEAISYYKLALAVNGEDHYFYLRKRGAITEADIAAYSLLGLLAVETSEDEFNASPEERRMYMDDVERRERLN